LDAAEKRRQEQENRGIKDIDKVRRAQQRKDNADKREEEIAKAGGGQGGLKVYELLFLWTTVI
jgi:small VCP/p97-interacting protein